MNNFSTMVVLLAALSLSACAQMGADKKTPEIQSRIDAGSTNYVNCMKAYAAKYAAATDSATILAEGAGVECGYLLDGVAADMGELVGMKYMSKSYQSKLIAEQLEALEKTARAQVIDTVVKARIGEF